jgi:hypothetical protein
MSINENHFNVNGDVYCYRLSLTEEKKIKMIEERKTYHPSYESMENLLKLKDEENYTYLIFLSVEKSREIEFLFTKTPVDITGHFKFFKKGKNATLLRVKDIMIPKIKEEIYRTYKDEDGIVECDITILLDKLKMFV